MGFLGWIILGLIVGAIVKAVMPGRVGGGTMEFWNLGSWLLAIVGGLVVALAYGAITGRKKTS